MFENPFVYWACFLLLPMLLAGLLGALIAWFLRPKPVAGDLTVEGEGRLRAEADELRARLRAVEAERDERVALVTDRETEISDLKGKLAAAAAGAAAAGAATTIAVKSQSETAADADAGPVADTKDEDETYALEWRNRYLAARVKYLESRLAEAPKAAESGSAATAATAAAAVAGAAVATKAASKPKPKARPKPKAKARPKPKVLYTDGPTDGPPDDLKLIKGIGPKFEKDLNSKGIYYFRQIGNWKAADVTMVEGVIDSIPGRISRDQWVSQAKGFAKGPVAASTKSATKSARKTAPKAKAAPRAKAASGTKPRAKVGTTTATKASSGVAASGKTAAGKTMSGKAANDASRRRAMERYFANVQRYDANADRDVVERIVKYCGVSLKSRDTSLVACRDMEERARIVRGFASRKLGIADKAERERLVEETCDTMKAQRQKSRVTFYYLMAQKAGKLNEVFGG